jgi:hypothetical protein
MESDGTKAKSCGRIAATEQRWSEGVRWREVGGSGANDVPSPRRLMSFERSVKRITQSVLFRQPSWRKVQCRCAREDPVGFKVVTIGDGRSRGFTRIQRRTIPCKKARIGKEARH